MSEVGTRQGCNLSPMIFNLCINELLKLLLKKIDSDPILLEGKEIPILMYVDDVVFTKPWSHLTVMNVVDRSG